MTDEKLYTLAEAKLELNREHCARTGHDFQIILATTHKGPERIICLQCGLAWKCEAEA